MQIVKPRSKRRRSKKINPDTSRRAMARAARSLARANQKREDDALRNVPLFVKSERELRPKKLDPRITPIEEEQAKGEGAGAKTNRPPRTYSVYVIELDRAALESPKFRKANPNYQEGQACLYVGSTAKTPEERFAQQQSGVKACKYVREHGLYLRRRLYARFNPIATRQEAEKQEEALALQLRARGYAVWFGT